MNDATEEFYGRRPRADICVEPPRSSALSVWDFIAIVHCAASIYITYIKGRSEYKNPTF